MTEKFPSSAKNPFEDVVAPAFRPASREELAAEMRKEGGWRGLERTIESALDELNVAEEIWKGNIENLKKWFPNDEILVMRPETQVQHLAQEWWNEIHELQKKRSVFIADLLKVREEAAKEAN